MRSARRHQVLAFCAVCGLVVLIRLVAPDSLQWHSGTQGISVQHTRASALAEPLTSPPPSRASRLPVTAPPQTASAAASASASTKTPPSATAAPSTATSVTSRPSVSPAVAAAASPFCPPAFDAQLPVLDPEACLPSFADAVQDMYLTQSDPQEALRAAAEVRQLQSDYPPDKPRGALVILAFPVHCGFFCTRGKPITQKAPISRNLAALARFHNTTFPYPVIMFHEDYTDADKAELRAAAGPTVPIVFIRLGLSSLALPSYYDAPAVHALMRDIHMQHGGRGNLSEPAMGTHGYGYRMMCRFFSALLVYHPAMRPLEFYMRIDGGDSRLDQLRQDPFRYMQQRKLAYLTNGAQSAAPHAAFSAAHAAFAAAHPELQWDAQLLQPFWSASSQRNTGQYWYNNLEVLDMGRMRMPAAWQYFLAVDRSQSFMFPRPNGVGDGEVRSMMVALLLRASEVAPVGPLVQYRHPVPWTDP